MEKPTGQRAVAALIAAPLMIMLIGLACTQEPTPEPTPAPTPVPVPLSELKITDATTVADMAAALSPSERDCLEEGEDFAALRSQPLASLAEDPQAIPRDCLSSSNAIDLSLAFMDHRAGGISPESRDCVREVGVQAPHVLGIGDPPEDPAQTLGRTLQMYLCLTDQEAEALSNRGSEDVPVPSTLRCMQQSLGGPGELEALLNTASAEQEKAEEAAFQLLSAALACETEPG